jgi:uncharacterized membrane protein
MCFSNLSPSIWSIHRIPDWNGSLISTSYLDLPFEAPLISTRAVISLFIVAATMSFLILVLAAMSACQNNRANTSKGTTKRQICSPLSLLVLRDTRSQIIIGILGLIFILAGAVLLRVQVSHTVSALEIASRDERFNFLFLEDSGTFWRVVWAAVSLMAVNPVLLALHAERLPR